jgi:hypothetical protein
MAFLITKGAIMLAAILVIIQDALRQGYISHECTVVSYGDPDFTEYARKIVTLQTEAFESDVNYYKTLASNSCVFYVAGWSNCTDPEIRFVSQLICKLGRDVSYYGDAIAYGRTNTTYATSIVASQLLSAYKRANYAELRLRWEQISPFLPDQLKCKSSYTVQSSVFNAGLEAGERITCYTSQADYNYFPKYGINAKCSALLYNPDAYLEPYAKFCVIMAYVCAAFALIVITIAVVVRAIR